MKIAVVSDSHDNLVNIEKAVEIFNQKGIAYLIHLGDVCSPFSVVLFNKLACEYVGVFGNNDGEWLGINKISGGRFYKGPIYREIFGKKIIIMHEGDIADFISREVDFVLFGHSHNPSIKKIGKQFIVNPGTLSGYMAKSATYAIIDTEKNTVEIVEV